MVWSGSITFWRQNLHSSGQISIFHWESTHKALVQVHLPHSCSFHPNSSWTTVAGGFFFWSLLLSDTWMTKVQDHQGSAWRPTRWAKSETFLTNVKYIYRYIYRYIYIYITKKISLSTNQPNRATVWNLEKHWDNETMKNVRQMVCTHSFVLLFHWNSHPSFSEVRILYLCPPEMMWII